jgi:acyl dehydratase
MRTIKGIDEMRSLKGEHLGYSEWHQVTQEQVNLFAEATGDHQWIHIDPERAKEGPFGRTIAHGYFTISMAPMLMSEVVRQEGVRMGVNYGINKLRFPAPLPVGEKVRMGVQLKEVDDIEGGVQSTYELTFEVDGQAKPACVAEVIYRSYV